MPLAARPAPTLAAVDAVLPTTPATALWGWFPAHRDPALEVASGAVVRIDAVNQAGAAAPGGPLAYFAALGVPADEVLPELVEVAAVPRTPGSSGHVLTGPVHVAGAEPGDVLQVDVLDVAPRVGYGVNASGHGAGVLPDLLDAPSVRLLRLDEAGTHYEFGHGIRVPAAPFAGIMAVAPPDDAVPADGVVSANPPDRWGGNMDVKDLTAGSTLYLPVFQPGAQLYVGDTHGAQGQGEVNQTAVEHSMALTARFTVRKDLRLTWPRVETPDRHLAMGAHADLDVALRIAVTEAIALLREKTDGALSAADAYALCSIAVDFVVAEAVDGNQLVTASVPKALLAGRVTAR